jgi:phospholipase D1/2
MEYIRFFNLRNYDRINVSGVMRAAEQISGVSYQQASDGRDAALESSRGDLESSGGGYQAYRPPPAPEYGVYEMDSSSGRPQGLSYSNEGNYGRPQQQAYEMDAEHNGSYGQGRPPAPQEQYQQSAAQLGERKGLGSGRWDSVSECYMLGGEDIRNIPWEGGAVNEIDAFVSEELYIHSKVSAQNASESSL